jgi:hypothetical protein
MRLRGLETPRGSHSRGGRSANDDPVPVVELARYEG